MDFVRLPIIAVVGIILYNEPIDALVILGGVLIFAANYVNIKFGQAKAAK
jgi:drug/metabolite transporter (DMT)-like permease